MKNSKVLKDNSEFIGYEFTEDHGPDLTFDEKIMWIGIGCLLAIFSFAIYASNNLSEFPVN